MLIEFKVANYRSIHAEQTLSMVASNCSDELPQNLIPCDLPGMKGTRLVKAIALYGANASGKSNVLAAMRFFAEFVRDSAMKLQPGAPTGTQPFKLDPASLHEPSKFEITAVINGVRTVYGLELTRERVTSEYLVAYPKGRPQVWFERDWNAEGKKYDWSKSSVHFKLDAALRERTRENAAFVSVGASFNQAQLVAAYTFITEKFYFLDVPKNVFSASAPDCTPWNTAALLTAIKEVEKNAEPNKSGHLLKNVIMQMMTNADLGISGADAEELDPDIDELWPNHDAETKLIIQKNLQEGNYKSWRVTFEHDGSGKESVPFDIKEESVGTQRYFSLLGYVLDMLVKSRLLIMDEIESSLNPQLVRALVESALHISQQSQLIFTTHNPLLLDQTLFRRDQIWFTEKDRAGATRLYPLTDYQPRKDESLVKGYLAGRYGGIPFIPEGLGAKI
jgi:AAA15 family ATPase/GTPase